MEEVEVADCSLNYGAFDLADRLQECQDKMTIAEQEFFPPGIDRVSLELESHYTELFLLGYYTYQIFSNSTWALLRRDENAMLFFGGILHYLLNQ